MNKQQDYPPYGSCSPECKSTTIDMKNPSYKTYPNVDYHCCICHKNTTAYVVSLSRFTCGGCAGLLCANCSWNADKFIYDFTKGNHSCFICYNKKFNKSIV